MVFVDEAGNQPAGLGMLYERGQVLDAGAISGTRGAYRLLDCREATSQQAGTRNIINLGYEPGTQASKRIQPLIDEGADGQRLRARLHQLSVAQVPFQPPGYHSVTPYLSLRDAAAAIDFYRRAFGAELVMKLDMPDGSIAHAEIRIGDSVLMLSEENADTGNGSPLSLGGSPVFFMIYVPDVDAAFAKALAAGASQIKPVEDQFYGDRSGTLKDPFGYQWTLATHVEDVSAEEGQRRMQAMLN